MLASIGEVLNVTTDARPVGCEAYSCLGMSYPLVSFVKTTVHSCLKTRQYKQATAIHDYIIIEAEAVLDTPELHDSGSRDFWLGKPALTT